MTGNLPSALLAAGHSAGEMPGAHTLSRMTRSSLVAEFTYKPPPEWLGEKKATQLRKHADCCVRMDRTTHAIVRRGPVAPFCCCPHDTFCMWFRCNIVHSRQAATI